MFTLLSALLCLGGLLAPFMFSPAHSQITSPYARYFPQAAADPANPREGQVYANTTAHKPKVYNGSAWLTLADLTGGTFTGSISAPNITANGSFISPYVTLTDAATVTWNMNAGQNATVTLGGNRTLSITNAVNGSSGCLVVKQDATGSRTLSLPAGSKVITSGAGAITLTTTASAIDMICYSYDGTNYLWNYGKSFT